MNVKRPNSRRNLDIAIDRIFGTEQNSIQIRTILANTIVGQLLPGGVVKGGSSLKFRYGDKTTRFTRDFDTARAEELDIFLEQLSKSLHDGWNGFNGRLVTKSPPSPKGIPGEYIMKPFEVKLAYMGKSWVTIPLEIGHNEIGDADSCDYYISPEITRLFVELGFPKPNPLPLMQIHHQIAQKLHALSFSESERAHDLIDLQLIAKHEEIDYALTKVTCKRLFDYRKQQQWPPTVTEGKSWSSLYAAQVNELDVMSSVSDAVVWVNGFIEKINNEI